MMTDEDILWDRLAGTILIYVENYAMQKKIDEREKTGKKGYSDELPFLKPSYPVDYEIENVEQFRDDEPWALEISKYQNINDLPGSLKKLVIGYLPRFFKDFPEYRDAECLKVRDVEKS